MNTTAVHAFHMYWFWWFVGWFTMFIVPEVYGLIHNWRYTLSASIWYLEKYQPGEAIPRWTAFHFLLIGVLAVMFVWLFFHFGMGWWR